MSEPSRSRWPLPRGRSLVIAIVVACIVVYGVVVALYAVNASATRVVGCQDDPPSDAITLSLDPQAVDAAGNRLAATLDVVSFGPLADAGSQLPAKDVTLIVTGTDGQRAQEIPAHSIPSSISVRLLTQGAVEDWPFDTHTAVTSVAALAGTGDAAAPVPVALCGSAQVPGWTFASHEVPGDASLVIDGEPVTKVAIAAHRSAATIAFGIVLLALMVVLPVLGITVAVTVLRGRRKAEATLTSWMAAMLFAVVPLRGFLPGSPPVGSWVDYLVVLWVVAGLVAGLVVHVIAWLRWAPPGGAQR